MKLKHWKHCLLLITACLVIGVLALGGCSSQKVPDGFPQKLVKFEVKLQNEGKPVSGASIMFLAESPVKYVALGNTGTNGVAALSTAINNYTKPGIPPGTYKAIISYTPKAPSELSNEQLGKMSEAEVTAYREKIDAEIAAIPKVVPAEWENAETTPVRINVPETAGNAVIEISDPKTYQQ
ncbi:MAG: hypothetical protein LBG58_04450 [Planctomycetaceae bacterium]|nr:hypothetical protein [Planctomycetaceae bacterium]